MVVRVAVVRGTVTHRYDWSTLPTLLLPTAADLSTVHLSPFWVHNRIWDLCSRPSCHTACSPDHYADGRAGHLCAGHLCAHAHLCAHSAARRPGTHGRYDSGWKKNKKNWEPAPSCFLRHCLLLLPHLRLFSMACFQAAPPRLCLTCVATLVCVGGREACVGGVRGSGTAVCRNCTESHSSWRWWRFA